jgi:cyclophilin family peptidyl-prolyl cis-trans isomerase/predicted GIY-YIG superfamily endonuclease
VPALPAVYVLACADGTLYTGSTTDLARRLDAHGRGKAAKYTRARRPVRLLAWWHPEDFDRARSQEALFKQLTRAGKLAALQTDEAFGCRVHKPPQTFDPAAHQEHLSMGHAPPQADELPAYTEEARTSQARITTAKGDIVFDFYPDDAPNHVAAFIKLAKAGFYDGLNFHRVEPGFVIQGGDPDGDGTGGPGYKLKAEFNSKSHLRGTVAMARSSNPDSAGSQFYVCLGDARFLDGQYTVFGNLTEGLDTIDKIRKGDVMTTVTIEPKPAA